MVKRSLIMMNHESYFQIPMFRMEMNKLTIKNIVSGWKANFFSIITEFSNEEPNFNEQVELKSMKPSFKHIIFCNLFCPSAGEEEQNTPTILYVLIACL